MQNNSDHAYGQEKIIAHDPVHGYSEAGLRWHRFDRYEIRDGVICPAPGANLEKYDPWELHRATRGKYRTVNTPYLDLLNLSRKLDANAVGRTRTTTIDQGAGTFCDGEKLILDWCQRYGLLGILPTQAEEIRLPVDIPDDGSSIEPAQSIYIRTGGRWFSKMYMSSIENTKDGIRITAREWQKPIVRNWYWYALEWRDEPLTGKFSEFFPNGPNVSKIQADFVKATGEHELFNCIRYPRPGTTEFWFVYGEPVHEFSLWAVRFRHAIELVSRHLAGYRPLLPADALTEAFNVSESYRMLESLDNTIAVGYHLNDGKLEAELASPSLISSFTRMALEDLIEGRKILRCDNCQNIFVSNEPRAKYCSNRCRNTAQSRRYRQRKEERATETA